MSNNFRKYPKTEARRIQGHSSTSLQIEGNSRTFKALNFCFQIQGHSTTFKFCTNTD